MRNLILLCIAVVIVLIGFYIYLEIDERRFIENLPQLPVEKMQTLDSAPSTVQPNEDAAEQIEPETQTDVLEASVDAPESFAEDNQGIQEWEVTGKDTVEETVENQLSPELEALFSTFHLLDEEIRALSVVIDPLINESISIDNRHIEISRALNPGPDYVTRQALNEERAALFAQTKELDPILFELQDEREQHIEEQDALLEEYGFLSREGFFETHREEYKAWKAAQ